MCVASLCVGSGTACVSSRDFTSLRSHRAQSAFQPKYQLQSGCTSITFEATRSIPMSTPPVVQHFSLLKPWQFQPEVSEQRSCVPLFSTKLLDCSDVMRKVVCYYSMNSPLQLRAYRTTQLPPLPLMNYLLQGLQQTEVYNSTWTCQ